jgi:hypothetical protein
MDRVARGRQGSGHYRERRKRELEREERPYGDWFVGRRDSPIERAWL